MSTADGSVLGNTQIYGGAPRNRAFNVVLLADGFTAAQQNDFNTACASFVTAFIGTPPFDELGPAINIFRVNVTSTDSGADDPVGRRRHGRDGAHLLRLDLRWQQHPAPAALQHHDGAAGRSGAGPRIHYRARGRQLDDLRRQRRRCRHLLARQRRDRDRHPRDGAHRVRAGRRVRRTMRAATRPDTIIIPAGEPSEPNVTTNTNRNTLKWRWAVASSTAIPTMSNPACNTVDTRPSPVPTGTVGLFEGAHYYHCGGFRPEYDCKMRALSVPFCRVCRQAIWNRIGPLATLQARARTPISVVARYPEHLDVFAVANNGRTMSNWWDVVERMGRLLPRARRHRLAWRIRIAGHRHQPLLRTSRSLHRRHRQSRLQLLVGRRERLARVVPDWQSAVPSRLDRQCRQPLHRSSRSLHDGVRRPRHVHVVARRHGLGELVPGHGRRCRQWRNGDGDRALPVPSRCVHGRHR